MRFEGKDRSKDGSGVCFDTSLADGGNGAGVRNTLWCYGYDVQPKVEFVEQEFLVDSQTCSDNRRKEKKRRETSCNVEHRVRINRTGN